MHPMLTVQDAERMDLVTPQDAEVTYCRVRSVQSYGECD